MPPRKATPRRPPSSRWKTSISQVSPGVVRIRGDDIRGLIGRRGFVETAHRVLTGRWPAPIQARMLEALLVACADHGPAAHITTATRVAASGGAPLHASLASGMAALGRHTGAFEDAARLLRDGVQAQKKKHQTPPQAARAIVERALRKKRHLAGYGHNIHKTGDPRANRLLQTQMELGLAGDHHDLALAIRDELHRRGKPLPINLDGAMGAVLGDLGLDPELATGLFILGRIPGLVAHYREETTRERPMRVWDPAGAEYAPETIMTPRPHRSPKR